MSLKGECYQLLFLKFWSSKYILDKKMMKNDVLVLKGVYR